MAIQLAIVYSSRHGHVRRIAEHLAGLAAARRADCSVIDVRSAKERVLDRFDAAIIAGSVHFGRHSAKLRRFVTRHRGRFIAIPSAFVSVSGAAASPGGRVEAERYMSDFVRVTGWEPDVRLSAAGAVLYTQYDPITRLMMKFASRIAGRETDTSRDWVYTNWEELDQFLHGFVDTLERYVHVGVRSDTGEPLESKTSEPLSPSSLNDAPTASIRTSRSRTSPAR